jgi:hypothetical protein
LFRKRQQPSPHPPQQGYSLGQGGHLGAPAPTPHTSPRLAITKEPAQAPGQAVSLLVFSSYHQCAQELSHALEHVAGSGRYSITWVNTLEQMLEMLAHYRFDSCLLDIGNPEIQQVEENAYQGFGTMPYVAVLNLASLNTQALQELEARGYYGYVGYPFDGQAVDNVLRALLQAMPEKNHEPPPMQESEQQRGMPIGSWPAMSSMHTHQESSPAARVSSSIPPVPGVSSPSPETLREPSITTPLSPAIESTALHGTAPLGGLVPITTQGDTFAIQPQLVRHRGLFVCWSPFDGSQRTLAALNLATALAFGGFRTLVGELRRPAGPLANYLHLTKEELSRSLLAAANASEHLLANKGYVLDRELLENHLMNAIPLDPRDENSPEVHLFLSGPPHNPQLLFNTAALDPNQSPFVPELLQMIRQYWDYAFIVVGSNPVDKLHWQAFRACDRLLVFLPPDESYLTQAGHILPAILKAANISPSNVDVILTQIDRGRLNEQMDPILRFLAKTSLVDDHQPSSLRTMLPRKHPQLEEKQLRMLERQLRKIAVSDSRRDKLEDNVKSILKVCGLEDKLAGILPDALPLMQSLRRKNHPLLPPVMQREFVATPYVLAIRDLLEAWIEVANNTPVLSKRQRAAQ